MVRGSRRASRENVPQAATTELKQWGGWKNLIK